MRHRLPAALIAVFLILFLITPVAVFFLIQSPRVVNSLSSLLENHTGYRVRVNSISFDRHLHAEVGGLEIRSIKDSSLFLTCSTAEVKGRFASSFKIEIDKILITHPSFVFQVRKSTEETNLFTALEKIPPVRLLVVQDGRLEVRNDGSAYVVPGIQLTVKDFSPKTGGNLKLEGRLSVSSPTYAFAGAFDGALKMSRFTPAPSGTGSIRVFLDTATFDPVALQQAACSFDIKIAGDVVSFEHFNIDIGTIASGQGLQELTLKDTHLKMNVSYDQKSSKFSIASLEGKGLGVGSLRGRCDGFMKPLSWAASVSASAIDVPRVFAIIRPLLPQEYRGWSFKGTGALAMQMKGRATDALSWSANVVLDLNEGGFASADNLKAGERIAGKIELKLTSPEKEAKGRFDVTMKAGDGELLWGKYYRDFKAEFLTVDSQCSFAESPFLLSCAGSADIFQTGRYAFSADLSPGTYLLRLDGSDLSHERLFALFARDYVAQNYPDLGDLTLKGASDIRFSTSIDDRAMNVSGHVAVRDTVFAAPSLGVFLSGVRLSLPLDFCYPGLTVTEPSDADQGILSVDRLVAGGVQVDNLTVPLFFSRNTILVPQQVSIPLFGGEARLTHLRVDHVFTPDVLFDAGLSIEHVNLGALTERLSPLAVYGTASVALPSIICRDGQWKTKGGVQAHVFGGEVEVTNISATNLFSRGRSLGGDVDFTDIDLEAMTDRLEVGRITGIIRGFVKDLAFEYGQPSRFALRIETDVTKKAPRKISVDAIKNLSIVSTGSSAVSAMLNSGVNRFFKEYPYSQIGIACNLENDAFSLRGTIHEGGKEYLVKRALFRGIDIINQNPENSISFKDMQERISRIFRPRQESKSVL
jgi:hypothetical protein